MYILDESPKLPDGSRFDGKDLLQLLRSGKSPFHGAWDVNVLKEEVEHNLHAQVIDMPFVSMGSNYYGIQMELSNGRNILARIARDDVNAPDFDGWPMHKQISDVEFEAATYELMLNVPKVLASHLLHHRTPVQHEGPRRQPPLDILGRRLFLFEMAEGRNNVWRDLGAEDKAHLLAQAAEMRASLFNYEIPFTFVFTWFRKRLFEPAPEPLPTFISPTREFCVTLLQYKVEATIGEVGDMIGWESDNEVVGPIAAACKQSLLRLIPHILPSEDAEEGQSLYRLVFEHGDFGIHNMSITTGTDGKPLITSLYDWETGCIVPALLSDPQMAVIVDLTADEDARPLVTRLPADATAEEYAEYVNWAEQYIEPLFSHAPTYEYSIRAGRDARHIWFALRAWRGEDPEGYFGKLGAWAEDRIKDLGVGGAQEVAGD